MGKLHFTVLLLIFSVLFPVGAEESTFEKAEKYYFQQKMTIAKSLLIQVINEDPEHPKAYSYLGDIALLNGQYNEAIKYFKTATEVSPAPALEYFRLGQVYIKVNDGSRALDSFKRAYSLDPSLKPALYQIGYVYLVLLRNKKETINYWTQFLKEAPNDPQYEKVERALKYLMDEKCSIPPMGSDISLEETLALGCRTVEPEDAEVSSTEAGHSEEKTNNETAGILPEDDL